ncbi:MAG TPA: SpoIID/LytB domain-containing protein [Clostridia bacterium]|nr:SpoIID/LytB domain-containing protein [Clostridia bacterium]
MNKKISLISLVENDSVFVSHAHKRIADVVTGFCPEAGTFESFKDAKSMLKGLSASFSHSKIVVVCAEKSRYIYLKKLLFQALNLESEASDMIATAITQHAPEENAEAKLSHTLLVNNSTVFLSEDGLFSGFAVKSGKQHLIVLPLDLDRLDVILEGNFSAYLKETVSSDNFLADTAVPAGVVTSVLSKLMTEDLCFAVANNKTAAFLKRRLSLADAWEDSFKFIDCDEDKNSLTQKEFIAGLARQAREKSGCTAGIAISNVFTSEKEDGRMFILVTIADTLRARVAKVYAEPEENAQELVTAAIETLLTMATDYIDAGGFSSFPVNQDKLDVPEEEKQNKSRLAIKLLISGVVVAIICVLIVLFGSQLVNAVKEYTGKGAEINQTQTAESAFASDSDESSSESESMVSGVYDPEYLISLLAQASSYAAEENLTTETDTTTPATTQNTTTNKKTPQSTNKPGSQTSKSQTTTTKPANPAITTTTRPTTSTTSASPEQLAGTFTFNTKGYGHGVGMSQEGAKTYARQGWSYNKILLHYYTPNVTLLDDPSKPTSVLYGGTSIELVEYLARTVAQEIGTGAPLEALKAQAVAAYTFAKSYKFNVARGQHAYSTAFNMDPNSNVLKAVNEVSGKYLSCGGNPINAFYFASTAGQTVSSASVWGGYVPYLQGGIKSPETVSQSRKTLTTEEFRTLVNEYNNNPKFANKKITLQDNPADWLKIISADSVDYVNIIRVGNREMRGYSFRQDLLKLKIRSHCFTFTYASA